MLFALAAEHAEDVAGGQVAIDQLVVTARAEGDAVAPGEAFVPAQGGGAQDFADILAADRGDAGEWGVGRFEQGGQHQADAQRGQRQQFAILEAQGQLERLADEGVGLGERIAEQQSFERPAGPAPGEDSGGEHGAGDQGDHDLVHGDGDDHDQRGDEGPHRAQPGVGVLLGEAALRAIEAFVALLLARLGLDFERHALAADSERHLSAQPVGRARPDHVCFIVSAASGLFQAASIGAGTRDMTSSSSDSAVEERRRDSALSTRRCGSTTRAISCTSSGST